MDTQTPSVHEQWQEFSERAMQVVRHGYELVRVKGLRDRRLVQVIILPSFQPFVAWQIFQRTPGEANASTEYVGLRTEWRHQEDWQKFYSPIEQAATLRLKHLNRLAPALGFFQMQVEADWVQAVDARLAALNVPVIVMQHDGVGLDGTRYELILGDYMAVITFHWWKNGPIEWKALSELTNNIFQTLERQYQSEKGT